MSALFCFGLGYTAEALARHVRPLGWAVCGTSTTRDGVAGITALGCEGLLFDGTAPGAGIAEALARSTRVLVSVPPDTDGDPVLRHHERDLAGAAGIRAIAYLSTIGVYGDCGGAWVDEESAPQPASERSRRRLAAEAAWQSLGERAEKRVRTFRLGGIYGPGRSAIDSIKDGTARRIVKPGQVFNRIHVDDVASVLAAELGGGGRFEVYNVTDDEPAPPQDVVAYAARLLGRTPPPEIPFAAAELSPMVRSFYADNRRVRNERIKDDLGVRLAYPTYREGLAAIFAASA
jgi:dTDP-4-dehydrorhamnose reductase